MSDWKTPETAPKSRMIIADFGLLGAVAAIWNPIQEQWAIAELEWSVLEGAGDPGFVTEWQHHSDMVSWQDFPRVLSKKTCNRSYDER
jgi:hypothetical protein